MLIIADNMVGAMTHSLSIDERQHVLHRGRELERELAASTCDLTQMETFVLGLTGGMLGSLASFAVAMRTSFSAEFDYAVLRTTQDDIA